MWRKCSEDSGVTDITLGINGWLLFSILHVRMSKGYNETTLIIFNHVIWESK